MSAAAAPWSVKGIDPKAREVAKDLARRSGMTLGEWLNTMIMDDEDDGVAPLPRRPHAAEMFDRRGRSRRLDDVYDVEPRPAARHPDEVLHRVAASVEAIAARLEAAERRSTVAIQGVDQAVTGLVRRLDGQDEQTRSYGRRIDDISEELKEGHRRLRRFEQEVGPEAAETFGKVEAGIGALAQRLYDIEERQRTGVNELRQRMDAAEKLAGPGPGTDLLAQVGARLDTAQARTTDALKGLERSFAGLDQRLRQAESRVEPEGLREAARFEKLAETLGRQVDANRVEIMRRLDTAETEGRVDRIERAVQAMAETVKAAEQRSAQDIEAMGREVLRIAQNLNGRIEGVEVREAGDIAALGESLKAKIDRDMGRYAQAVEQRLNRSDDHHALALEKLGGEITRISDRLADRIAQSERKSAQAIEDIGRRLSDSTDRIDQRHDRASGELAERMRLSEERTAKLLIEARESLDQRIVRIERETPIEPPRPSAPDPRSTDLQQPDWRAAAFGGGDFDSGLDDGWSTDPLSAGPGPAPFPGMVSAPAEAFAAPRLKAAPPPPKPEPAFEPAFEPAIEPVYAAEAPRPLSEPFGAAVHSAAPSAAPSAGFGGADVSDALEATASPRGLPSAAIPGPAVDLDGGQDEFAAETEFVDARSLRASMGAGAAAGRAASTRGAIEAARAAMTTPAEEAPRSAFGLGLKRGGKTRLQERLDKQAARDGSTVRKALLASVTSMAVIGGLYATSRLTGAEGFTVPGLDRLTRDLGDAGRARAEPTLPMAAVAFTGATPTDAVPVANSEAQALYDRAVAQIEAEEAGGVDALTQAANLGLPTAQLKLAGLYETGDAGVARDPVEARKWARRAAESADPRGMHAYGMYLFDGVGGARNRPEALDWLLKAANQGLVDSQYNVARLYENGDEGIAPNPTEAFKWYLVAARTGDEPAQVAVDRLTPGTPAASRRRARAAAEIFQVAPLA